MQFTHGVNGAPAAYHADPAAQPARETTSGPLGRMPRLAECHLLTTAGAMAQECIAGMFPHILIVLTKGHSYPLRYNEDAFHYFT